MKLRFPLFFAGVLGVVLLLGSSLLGSTFIPTHDGEYHIIRFMEFYKVLSSGHPFPRWAPTLNSGYGVPIFMFHYPFPNYIGSVFHLLGFQFVDAFKLSLFAGYLVSAVGCYLFLLKLWDKRAAFIGTIASLAVPYWFVDIYVRGSVGEVWAIAWAFVAVASLVWKKELFLALAVCFLILSHNIQALLFMPLVTLYAWYAYRQSIRAIILGVALASYFWIPALLERSFVVGLSTVNPLDHFTSWWELLVPSWGTEFSGQSFAANKMSFQIGIMPLLWLGISVWLLIKTKTAKHHIVVLSSVLLALVSIFLMLPYSTLVWNYVPGLSYVQYPWRLLAWFIPIIGIAAAYVSTKVSSRLAFGMAVLSVLLIHGYTKPVLYERRDDAYYASRPNFTDGTSSMGNAFSTIWTPWKPTRAPSPVEVASGSATILLKEHTPLSTVFSVEVNKSTDLVVNRLYYPGWHAYEGKRLIPIVYENDGLIHIFMPEGTHAVTVQFEETLLRKIANSISLLSLLWFFGWAILTCIYAYRHKHGFHVRRTQ